MEIIHANENLEEIQMLTQFNQYEAISGLGSAYSDNDFELQITEAEFIALGIGMNHHLYQLDSEWGGRIENVEHVGATVKSSGPTWRGMLARKIISPPAGQAYRTITTMEANQAIAALVGSSLGSLFTVSTANSGVTVSGSFRYTNLLGAIHSMLQQYGARLAVVFNGTNVVLSAIPVIDYTDIEISSEYNMPIESGFLQGEAYNHIIALGQGELEERQTIELWRLDNGEITSVAQANNENDKQTVLDYPNVESLEELTNKAVEKLIEHAPEQSIKIDLNDTSINFELGDVVGGADAITALKIRKPITQKILKVDGDGKKINYKAGD
nr:hypothetical protein [uncultured Trichococcus sp.]